MTQVAIDQTMINLGKEYGITDVLHLAAWLATMSHESAGFTRQRENMNYSVSGLMNTFVAWKRMKPSEAYEYGRTALNKANQTMIASIVYANRLGNGDVASQDGWLYRGGGFIQLTGKMNYRIYGEQIGVDLASAPHMIEDTMVSLHVAARYWQKNQLGNVLDDHGFEAVQNYVNRGNIDKPAHGMEQRQRAYSRFIRTVVNAI